MFGFLTMNVDITNYNDQLLNANAEARFSKPRQSKPRLGLFIPESLSKDAYDDLPVKAGNALTRPRSHASKMHNFVTLLRWHFPRRLLCLIYMTRKSFRGSTPTSIHLYYSLLSF